MTLITRTPNERVVLCGLCDKPILPLLNYIFLTVVSKSIIRAIQLDIPNLCRESGNIKCHFIQFFKIANF